MCADDIEVNITEGQERVKKGIESLEKASDHQKKSRGKVCMTAVPVAIVLVSSICHSRPFAITPCICRVRICFLCSPPTADRDVGPDPGHRHHDRSCAIFEIEVKSELRNTFA